MRKDRDADVTASAAPPSAVRTSLSSGVRLGGLLLGGDDPYCAVDAATRLAADWDIPLITTRNHGHLNSDSNLGLWPYGQHLLTSFLAGLRTS